ncbi:MAG: hypothetical protein BWK75_04500 [Candidatus Altiarchaeales archaeon A3]|nr:MAG: hypothetical protein BWK75_04500 [Candidatus Altiarchaeales archaeon A3]
MKCWKYRNDMPQVPVRLIGKISVEEWALVDSGATYCVVHPMIARMMELKFIDEKQDGSGGKKSIIADVANIGLEIDDFKEKIDVVCIREEYYPVKAHKVIIGRNFMNKYRIILDGEQICIENKEKLCLKS